ncbi:MAG: hypothetical protein GC152_08135 [Alphaproteobacteria bacterium]|nr:hypothetical protein [Alphaproteobacteria bacterium]
MQILFRLLLLAGALGAMITSGADANGKSADQAQPAEYFATLPFRETPFSPLKGIHRISAEEARTRKHFRFEYDAEGRPTQVSFMQGERAVSLNDSADYYFFAPRLKIEYGAKTETRAFFDKHGNRIAVNGDVFQEVYRLDERGYRRSLEFYNVDGDPVENSWGIARYEWSLLDDGSVAEKRYGINGELAQLRSGFPFFEVRFHYGPYGWLALMQNYGVNGRLTMNELNAAQDRLEYAANGDLLSWNVLDVDGNYSVGNGPGVARGILERSAEGYEIVERYENADGEPIANSYGFSYTRKVNDRFGNRIEASNFTLDGRQLMISEGRGYAGWRATYDDDGRNRTKIEFFGAERRPVIRGDRGYFAIRFEYDESDNEIAVYYEGANGEPVNSNDAGVAKIERNYDNRGRLTRTRHLDKTGTLVNHANAGFAVEERTYDDAHGVPETVARYSANGELIELVP